MSAFVIFLICASLNTGAAVAVKQSEHGSTALTAPVVVVVEDGLMYPYAPVVTFDAPKRDGFFFEVDYLTPVGRVSFRTVTTNKHFDFVYGASCLVRVRQSNGVLHSKWSESVFVNQIVPATTQAQVF